MIPASVIELLQISRFEQVYGGDVNQCFSVESDGNHCFLKLNNAIQFPGMFEKEANGLQNLRKFFPGKVPDVISNGDNDGVQYLLLEWLDTAKPQPGSWEKMGAALAQMHLQQQDRFGWECNNYIGTVVQQNKQTDEWYIFYRDSRILPLADLLYQAGKFTLKERMLTDRFCEQLPGLFPNEKAAFLHGDLWSGNVLFTGDGSVALFDPAVYKGHREMDIGMTTLFGGFTPSFYSSYNEIYPLEEGWKERIAVAQLYPLLVHSLLFGSTYSTRSIEIMNQFAGRK